MVSRRQVLAAGCLALAGGAGCSKIRDALADDTTSDETETATSDATGTSEAETESREETTETDAADPSEFRITVTDGDEEVELVTGEDVASVGEVEQARSGDGYRIPVTLTDEGTAAFADGLESVGAFEDPESHRIRTYFESERLYEAKLGPGLADAIESGEWDGSFLLHVTDRETAEDVKDALESE
jgi:hypothetical protein